MAPATLAIKGLGRRVAACPPRPQFRIQPVPRRPVVISASKDAHGAPARSASPIELRQTAGAWLKTGLIAGACYFIGFGSGAAHAAKKASPPPAEPAAVAVVDQRATSSPSATAGNGAQAAVDWEKLAKDVQASPYTVPIVVVVLLIAGMGLLGGSSKQESSSASSTNAAGETPSTAQAEGTSPPLQQPQPAAQVAPTAEEQAGPAVATAPTPAPAAPVVVKPRPMNVSANPNMGSTSARPPPPPPPPPAPVPTAAAAEPVAPATATPAPAAAPTVKAPEPAPAPPAPAPVAAVKDSRPSAKEWIANWRASQPAKPAPVAAATPAPAPPQEPPAPTTAAAPAPPVPAPAPTVVGDGRPSAKDWIANWRASQPPKQAPEPAPEAASRPPPAPAAEVPSNESANVVSSAAKGPSVVATEEYVLFKFTEDGTAATSQPISILEPSAASASISPFDSTISDTDVDEPAPPKPATATVAAARVVQGTPPTVAPQPPAVSTAAPAVKPSTPSVSGKNGNARKLDTVAVAPATAPKATPASPSSSSAASSSGVSEESLAEAARDPIVMTAAVVVGAARQMKGFGAFVSDGLVPAVGALLGASNSSSGANGKTSRPSDGQ